MGEDEDYQKAGKVVADKVPMDTVKTMNNHPIGEFKGCIAKLPVIEKDGTRLDYTYIVIIKVFRAEILARPHLLHAGKRKTILDITTK